MIKRVLESHGAKALLVLPYVALVQEKVQWLRKILQSVRPPPDPTDCDSPDEPWKRKPEQTALRVIGFFGGGKVRSTWNDFDIGVCTLEKVSSSAM